MSHKITRNGHHFTAVEVREVAVILAKIWKLREELFRKVHGRARTEWAEPLRQGGRAWKFMETFQSAMDDDWGVWIDPDPTTSPFYGSNFMKLARDADAKEPT